jgi:hypothetical protein
MSAKARRASSEGTLSLSAESLPNCPLDRISWQRQRKRERG